MPELSVIVPAFNESETVRELVGRLDIALRGVDWEVVFVDDSSPDGTADVVRDLAQEDRRVRGLQRYGRRGLSSACIEGLLSTSSPWCAVMDADLQHDERLLPDMLALLRTGDADVVVGTRYAHGGSTGEWSRKRRVASRAATRLTQALVGTTLSDPMSGFFALRRDVLHHALPRLSGVGFKILLDLLASAPSAPRVREVPYTFRPRFAGESKLDSMVAWEFLMLLGDKWVGHIIPVRFLLFSLIGALGVVVHMATVAAGLSWVGATFTTSQAVATLVAMSSNYLLNNMLTYRDLRLRGLRLLWGWLTFALACGIGAMANVGVSSYIYEVRNTGWAPAALAGIVISSVWNYVASGVVTWRPRHAPSSIPRKRTPWINRFSTTNADPSDAAWPRPSGSSPPV